MDRLIEEFPLRRGAHPTRGDGMCAMEMVAWLAGEPHSDEPSCACPVLAAYVRACNDTLGDGPRNRLLRPLVPLLVNSRGDRALERARGLAVIDALVRSHLPFLLQRRNRHDEAALLAALPAVVDPESLRTACRALDHYARDQHAARWVLQRALDGLPPQRYVAGAVQVLRGQADPRLWASVAERIAQLANLGRSAAAGATAEAE